MESASNTKYTTIHFQLCVNLFITINVLKIEHGIPDELMRANSVLRPLSPWAVPSLQEATRSFHSLRGHLSDPANFGEDPLEKYEHLLEYREQEFTRRFPSFDFTFHRVVHGDATPLFQTISYFLRLTRQIAQGLVGN